MNDMSEFGAIPYAAGTIRGFRHFRLRPDGILDGVVYTSPWFPGPNEATCKAAFPRSIAEIPSIEDLGVEEWNIQYEEYKKLRDHWVDTHRVIDCNHGFYAYFDGVDDAYLTYPSITGIIEGYGEVLIGTKGFRAMKAHILALSVEPFSEVWLPNPVAVERLRTNFDVPVFESTAAMRAEFPCPNTYLEDAA